MVKFLCQASRHCVSRLCTEELLLGWEHTWLCSFDETMGIPPAVACQHAPREAAMVLKACSESHGFMGTEPESLRLLGRFA